MGIEKWSASGSAAWMRDRLKGEEEKSVYPPSLMPVRPQALPF